MIIKPDNFKEMWRQSVHNKAHRIMHDAQDLQGAFFALLDGQSALGICDKINLVERQIALVRGELGRLTEITGKATSIIDRLVEVAKEHQEEEEELHPTWRVVSPGANFTDYRHSTAFLSQDAAEEWMSTIEQDTSCEPLYVEIGTNQRLDEINQGEPRWT